LSLESFPGCRRRAPSGALAGDSREDGAVDLTGWTPVTDAAGKVLGWTAPADVETPHERAHRIRVAGLRAAAVAEVADLAHSRAFDLDEVGAAGTERFGADVVGAAFDVVYELMQVEQLRE
jgi:hypothetical protein